MDYACKVIFYLRECNYILKGKIMQIGILCEIILATRVFWLSEEGIKVINLISGLETELYITCSR
jgi:hypothetical protein